MKLLQALRNLPALLRALLVYRRAARLLDAYIAKPDPKLLEKMRAIKPSMRVLTMALCANEQGVLATNFCWTLGRLSLNLHEYAEAWDVYERGKQLAEAKGDAHEIAAGYTNLGAVAEAQGDHDVALEMYRTAGEHARKLDPNDRLAAHIRSNIARMEPRARRAR